MSGGAHVWLGGGGQLVRAFLADRLVDEVRLAVVPVLLGEGLPLFPPGSPRQPLRLVSAEALGDGLVELRYDRIHDGP